MERNSRKIIKRLKKDGFELVAVSGDHHKFRMGAKIVTVPHPVKDLPTGTVKAIEKQAGWTRKDKK